MPDSSHPFSPSLLKVGRARRHINELSQLLEPWLESGPVIWNEFKSWVNPDGTVGFTLSTEVKPPPEETPAVMGDIVHNLRSSLDLMATALAEANGERGDNVHFPFSATADDIDLMIERKGFYRCGAEAVDLLRTFAPWKGGNELLRAIHDLDIIDKHKRLIPVPDPGGLVTVPLLGGQYPDGRLILGAPEIVQGPPPLEFQEETGLGNRPVFQTFEEMVQLCERILEAFVPVHQGAQAGRDQGGDTSGKTLGASCSADGFSITEVGPAQ